MPDLSKYSALQILMLIQKGVLAYSPDSIGPAVNSGKTKIYEELNSGRLRAKKLGDKTIIPFWSAIDWLAALPDYPAPTPMEGQLPSGALAVSRQELSNLDAAGVAIGADASVKILTEENNGD